MKSILLLFLVLAMIYPITVFAEPSITLDKNSYVIDDVIKISGKVVFDANSSIVIQIRSTSDIVAIKQFSPSKSGTFSTSFDAAGPKWTQSGTYTVIVSYTGEKSEKTFNFSAVNISEKNEISKTDQIKIEKNQENNKIQKPNLKISMSDFPDPALSPNYYINLYNTDSVFKKLFDTTFPGYKIQEIVGYKPTNVAGFPDPNLSPQYYIDRYSNEPRFRIWFDSQFTDRTIYDIIGMSDNTKPSIPSWIKQYTQLWSIGEISDSQFATGISELIQKKILLIDDDIVKTSNQDSSIPGWFKNAALWYSKGIITEEDFLLGLQYLIEKEIIII
ncbi:hypothetical protein [Candidatus Nitrosarchaeum limnium]|jgi:uncharacterized protein (UPF0333 family)|nr:hypothetical protein [Candidatus Nitrosarchaeum limnium]